MFYISNQNCNPQNPHQLTLEMLRFSSQKLGRPQNFHIQQGMPRNTSTPAGLRNSQLWGLSFIRNCKRSFSLHLAWGGQSHRQAVFLPRQVPYKNAAVKVFLKINCYHHRDRGGVPCTLPNNSSQLLCTETSCLFQESGINLQVGARTQRPDIAIAHALAVKSPCKPTPNLTGGSFCVWSEGKGNNYTISNHRYCFNDCISILQA